MMGGVDEKKESGVISVRLAQVADARGIAEVQVTTWRSAYDGVLSADFLRDMSVDKQISNWEKSIREKGQQEREIFVVEIEGHIVGFCAAGGERGDSADTETGEIYALYALPEFWDQHVGSSLFSSAEKFLKKKYRRACLWVLESNPRARAFYKRKGWSTDGQTKMFEKVSPSVREVRYKKDF